MLTIGEIMTKIKVAVSVAIVALAFGLGFAQAFMPAQGCMITLYADRDSAGIAEVASVLQEWEYKYKLDNNGRNLLVSKADMVGVFLDLLIANYPIRKLELWRSVELHLEKQLVKSLDETLGPNKAKVKILAFLNFIQIINKSNCEMSMDVAQIISSPGIVVSLNISVLVDGYEEGDRAMLTKAVKNSVVFSQERDDDVCISFFKANKYVKDFASASMGYYCF
jgi:flagellar biosynthesis/type III secretory pathway M-ring protein FliF/YscJ